MNGAGVIGYITGMALFYGLVGYGIYRLIKWFVKKRKKKE